MKMERHWSFKLNEELTLVFLDWQTITIGWWKRRNYISDHGEKQSKASAKIAKNSSKHPTKISLEKKPIQKYKSKKKKGIKIQHQKHQREDQSKKISAKDAQFNLGHTLEAQKVAWHRSLSMKVSFKCWAIMWKHFALKSSVKDYQSKHSIIALTNFQKDIYYSWWDQHKVSWGGLGSLCKTRPWSITNPKKNFTPRCNYQGKKWLRKHFPH